MDGLDYGDLKIKFDTVCMQNEELIKALEAVEWFSTLFTNPMCPWCHHTPSMGHSPDCQRQKALQIEVHNVTKI